MTDTQVSYYHKMSERKRLFRITLNEELKGIITFYIGSLSDRYVRDNSWEILNDEPENGTVCFIDHLIIPNREKENSLYSFQVWKMFKDFIKENYPRVRLIRWNRIKNNKIYIRYNFLK